jgi:hypothetical protein
MGALVQSGVRLGVSVLAAAVGLFVLAPPTLSSRGLEQL